MTRVIDFAERENAAGGPSSPPKLWRDARERKKRDIIISVCSMPEYTERCKSKSDHIVGLLRLDFHDLLMTKTTL